MENSNKKAKKWGIWFVAAGLGILILLGGFVVLIDPFFHYHGPLGNVQYSLYNERYQNDGIVKHFDYDALITGSSMTENFKVSELDEIFGVTSVKACFAGGSAKEVNDLVETALKANPDLKMVVRCIDFNRVFEDKDAKDYDEDSYPTYLYDDNIFNDTKYIFNMEVLVQALQDFVGIDADGRIKTDFDAYANWMWYYPCGKDIVNDYYKRDTLTYVGSQSLPTDEEYATLKANFEQNFIAAAKENPDTEFYYYFTPYSIYYMDYFYANGDLEKYLLAEKYIMELLLPYENIHLYTFFDNHELMWNIDVYRDVAHHSETVNSEILEWLHDGTGLVTEENYEEVWQAQYDYFMNLDYDAMYAELSGRDDVVLYH